MAARPPGSGSTVPAAVADFPAEIVRPPREWSRAGALRPAPLDRDADRGGHFAALEEPELLADDLLAFLSEL